MDSCLLSKKLKQGSAQENGMLPCENKTDKQVQLKGLYNKVQSNLELQKVSLSKLAARENQEKGLGKDKALNEIDFAELRGSTEELLRLLYAQRMREFSKT